VCRATSFGDQFGGAEGPPNKRMQLTKLRAAPVRQAEVPPCAPAGQRDGGTASQLIRGVGQTVAKSIMARIAGLALLSIAFTAVCGYRPCGGPPTRLLGSLVSQATPEQAKSTLRPGQWVVEREEPGPTDGRPPFAFKTVDVGEIVDLGHRGRLRLVFYNGRLASALFTPDDASAYFAQVQGLEGAAMLPGGIVSLGSATRVTRLGLSSEGPVIEWYDACLRADQDAWIARYA